MKIKFGYYQGYTYSEFYKYVIKQRILAFFYRWLYKFYTPEIVDSKTLFMNRFSLVDENGNDVIRQYPPIIEYNNKTHKGYILETEIFTPHAIKLKTDENGEPIKKEIDMPNTRLIYRP